MTDPNKDKDKDKGGKPDEPQTVKIGDKDVPVDEAGKALEYYENKAKFETEYHKTGERANKLEREVEELKKQVEKQTKKEVKEETLPKLPDDDDPKFVDALIERVNFLTDTLKKQTEKVDKLERGMHKDIVEEVGRENKSRLDAFTAENKLTEDEVEQVKKIVAYSHRNISRADGKVFEVHPEAFEDALLIIRKKEARKKAEEAGKDSLLKELFPGSDEKKLKGDEDGADADEPSLKWLADNWHKMTDEQKDKHRHRLGREPAAMA
jgi:hypothetical protein